MSAQLLQIIGNIFYVMAKADRNLTFEEYVKYSQLLEKNWKHIPDDKINIIKKHFNSLQKDQVSAEICFSEFISYFNQNPKEFSCELKNLILNTAQSIAHAYSKINKSELHYLTKLKLEFEKSTK